MQKYILLLLVLVSFETFAALSADYKVRKGKLHQGGKIKVEILPNKKIFQVKMTYNVKKKKMVPVPAKLLKGNTIMEFPEDFRTEKGYLKLEKEKSLEIKKARLEFVRRVDLPRHRNGYMIKVFPKNKKTEITILYHPNLPAVGWEEVEIKFLSDLPLLDGYEIVADLK